MKVVIIYEENHGAIGVAISIQEAVRWLIESEWLTDCDEFDARYDAKKQAWVGVTPSQHFGENWQDVMLTLTDDELISFCDGIFYFDTTELRGAE